VTGRRCDQLARGLARSIEQRGVSVPDLWSGETRSNIVTVSISGGRWNRPQRGEKQPQADHRTWVVRTYRKAAAEETTRYFSPPRRTARDLRPRVALRPLHQGVQFQPLAGVVFQRGHAQPQQWFRLFHLSVGRLHGLDAWKVNGRGWRSFKGGSASPATEHVPVRLLHKEMLSSGG